MASDSDLMPDRLPSLKDRTPLENLLLRRFFIAPAFEIHGGCRGLYDYGPPGCAMQANMLEVWRRHFILEDNLQEINSTCLTPSIVLETSGHVERFKDFMVSDLLDGTCHRADHLLEDKITELLDKNEQAKPEERLPQEKVTEMMRDRTRADDMSVSELAEALVKYNVKSPDTGNDITPPFPFNLMFQTSIGPTGKETGFMRPELAQGIFVNFHRLLEQNGGRMPFGGACIGRAFRNEISPRQGVLRVREFTLAEIEFFVHPDKKDHERFDEVRHVVLNLWPRDRQIAADHRYYSITIGAAVDQGIVANQTLGYYLARVQLFLVSCGARPQWVRFRQHLENEMAHYASDCWDAEMLTSYGWVECVGNADRAAYDLTVHMKKTGARLACWESFDQPQTVHALVAQPNKAEIGKSLRTHAAHIFTYLAGLDDDAVAALQQRFQATPEGVAITLPDGQSVTLTPKMITFANVAKKVSGRWVTPSVIEPSFGIGRIQYALLEHSFFARPEDAQRGVLSLSPLVAPIKCSVLPLMVKDELLPKTKEIAHLLTRHGISAKVDLGGAAIGRRYARTDEIGIPYGITVDYDTIEKPDSELFDTVTLRDRDSMDQLRIPIKDLPRLLDDLVDLRVKWEDLLTKYPRQAAASSSSTNDEVRVSSP